jgi:hypothetical protein
MDQSDVITQLECWEKRANKHDFRVSMAGEDSETSRHRAEELRRCAAELRKLAGIPEPEPVSETSPKPTAPPENQNSETSRKVEPEPAPFIDDPQHGSLPHA